MAKNLLKNIREKYDLFIFFLFMIYISGMLLFCRAFAVIHFSVNDFSIYITEIFLFLSLPYIWLHRREILHLPRSFLCPFFLYFSISFIYFIGGILHGNIFALRDVVLSGYLLFLPLTFFIVRRIDPTFIIKYIIFVNLGMIIVGIVRWYMPFLPTLLADFLGRTKGFNYGLYYGMALSFFCAIGLLHNKKSNVFLFVVLAVVNSFMIINISKRSVWVAFVLFILYFAAFMRTRFFKFLGKVVLCFIFIFPLLFFVENHFSFQKKNNTFEKQAASLLALGHNMSILVGSSLENMHFFIFETDAERDAVPEVSLDDRIRNKLGDDYKKIGSTSFSNAVWRLDVWAQAIAFGLERPLLGRGFGVNPSYKIWGSEVDPPDCLGENSGVVPTHNHLVTIFFKMGIVGLLLFLYINGYVFWFVSREMKGAITDVDKQFLFGCLGALVFWHGLASFFDVINSPSTSIFLWVIIGLIFACVKRQGKVDISINLE